MAGIKLIQRDKNYDEWNMTLLLFGVGRNTVLSTIIMRKEDKSSKLIFWIDQEK